MATSTTVFSRVTVVAPHTRIDVALPADVAVADLMPMLLEMAREVSPDGGARHGGWCLARLGGAQLDPSRTLASLGIIDGDLLQLRKRSDNPPPPLYDDVVDAIAAATPTSFRPWTKETARKVAHIASGAALVLAAVALLLAGPLQGGPSIGPAIAAGAAAIVLIALGGTLARVYDAGGTAVLVTACGSLPMAFVAGLYAVPDGPAAPNLLLGAILVVVFSAAAIWLVGQGFTTFIAAGAAGFIAFLAFVVATVLDNVTGPEIAAGAAAVSLACISVLPRVTIQLSRLPLPNVPSDAEDLKENTSFPDFAQIEKRSGMAHDYLTGLIVGCGVAAALSAVVAATQGTIWGFLLAIVVTLVLLLRGRTYANGAQAIALLATGMIAGAGMMFGWLSVSPPATRFIIFAVLIVVAAAALVVGVIFPEQKFSPVMRRAVDITEGVLIAAVLPLALAVMELYDTVRHLRIGG